MRKSMNPVKPWRGASDTRHGTPAGYSYWGCRCDRCRSSASEAAREMRSQPPIGKHGRFNYDRGCRCDVCVGAKMLEGRSQREARREWKKANGSIGSTSTKVDLSKLL